jgi:hypothetical protein
MPPFSSEPTEAFRLPDSLEAHESRRHPKKSKSLPAGSNSSKKYLTVRGMFTPSGQTWE